MFRMDLRKKQRILSYTGFSNWFLKPRKQVFSARYELDL